jgi:hypothetical protein
MVLFFMVERAPRAAILARQNPARNSLDASTRNRHTLRTMSKLTKLPALNTVPPSMPKPPENLDYTPNPEGQDEDPLGLEVEIPAASQVRQRRSPAEHVVEKLLKCDIGDIEGAALLLVRDHTALASLLFNSLGAADARRQQQLIEAQQRQQLALRQSLPDSHPMMQPRGS